MDCARQVLVLLGIDNRGCLTATDLHASIILFRSLLVMNNMMARSCEILVPVHAACEKMMRSTRSLSVVALAALFQCAEMDQSYDPTTSSNNTVHNTSTPTSFLQSGAAKLRTYCPTNRLAFSFSSDAGFERSEMQVRGTVTAGNGGEINGNGLGSG
jgi:hypothetical protein